MMKTLKTAIFSCTVILACSSVALADGNAFTPLTFDDASYGGNMNNVTPAVSNVQAQEAIGNDKLQSAILQLDNAQVDVRNELLKYKAQYSDVDNRYQAIKAERKALNKQVRSIEKRIKKIDKQKEAIRKNMI